MKYVSYWQKKSPVIVKQFFRLSAQLYVWEWSVGPLLCYGVVVKYVKYGDDENLVHDVSLVDVALVHTG